MKGLTRAWIFFWWLMIRWFTLSAVGFLSGGVILVFILKHHFKVKTKFWWLNDTADGDYGAPWWLEKKGYTPGLWSAFNWWFRNHSWNFISSFKPPWGDFDQIVILKSTVLYDPKYGIFTRASAKNLGVNYLVYRVNGKTAFQYSYANKFITLQFGGGSEYRFRIKFK